MLSVLERAMFLSVMFLSVFVTPAAFAANVASDTLRLAWFAPGSAMGQDTDFEHDSGPDGQYAGYLAKSCIGQSLDNCAVWVKGSPDKDMSKNRGTNSDEGAILMLVARKMNSRGAYFCPTQIQAGNRDLTWFDWGYGCAQTSKASSWTSYYSPKGAESECFWLCKDGYYGEECQYQTPQECSYGSVLRSHFDGFKIATSGSDIDADIPMFYRGTWKNAWSDRDSGEEYDTILAVTDFTATGNGAFVAPIAVRAYKYEYWKRTDRGTCPDRKYVSTPYLKKESSSTLVCKDGYKPNADKSDCEPTDMCAIQEAELKQRAIAPCSGFDKFNETLHTKIYAGDGSCYKYKCTNVLSGFKSITDHSCVDCTGRASDIAPNNVCITCPLGTRFDYASEDKGFCIKSETISKKELLYGKDGQLTTDVSKQCWTFTDGEKYTNCVKQGVNSVE